MEKTLKRETWRRSAVFVANLEQTQFEHINNYYMLMKIK